jgi:hypothetical protein
VSCNRHHLEEDMPDSNVVKVSDLLISRANRGLLKYGVTTERQDLSMLDWLQHLQEELLDAAVYVERLKQEVTKIYD